MANMIPGHVLQVIRSNAEIGQMATAQARLKTRRSRMLADMRNARHQSPLSGRRFKRNGTHGGGGGGQSSSGFQPLIVFSVSGSRFDKLKAPSVPRGMPLLLSPPTPAVKAGDTSSVG
jgi:hypothetical protein